jgi:hypothetical protein
VPGDGGNGIKGKRLDSSTRTPLWNVGVEQGKVPNSIIHRNRETIVTRCLDRSGRPIILNQDRIHGKEDLIPHMCAEGRTLGRVYSRRATRLDIMKSREGSQLTQRFVGEMTVSGRVHTGEVDMHARVMTANETTTALTKMHAKAVEWNAKRGDVEDITNKQALPIERDDGRTPPKGRSIGVVSHPTTEVLNRFVGDERQAIRNHMISHPSIRHDKTKRGTNILGRDRLEQSQHKTRRKDNVI